MMGKSDMRFVDRLLLGEVQCDFVESSGMHGEYTDLEGDSVAIKNFRAAPAEFRQWRMSKTGSKVWREGVREVCRDFERASEPVPLHCGTFSGFAAPVRLGDRLILVAISGGAGGDPPDGRAARAGASLLARIAAESAFDRSRAATQTEEGWAGPRSDEFPGFDPLEPHFLFNMLNVIRGLAVMQGASEVAAALQDLAGFFRHTLRRKDQIVALSEEIENAERYLELQRRRFGERIRWQVHHGPGLDAVRVPCLLIQPLVENAIRHGIDPLKDGGTVIIRAFTFRDDAVCIEVSDNGAGAEAFTVASLLDRPRRPDVRSRWGIGIVRARLERYYGPRARMAISAYPNQGFWVQLVLPLDAAAPRPDLSVRRR